MIFKLSELRALYLVISYDLVRSRKIVKNKPELQTRSDLFTSLKDASLVQSL